MMALEKHPVSLQIRPPTPGLSEDFSELEPSVASEAVDNAEHGAPAAAVRRFTRALSFYHRAPAEDER